MKAGYTVPAPAAGAPIACAVSGETPATRLLLDLAAAVVCGALVTGLLVARGGIWEYVSSGDLHANILPAFEYTAHAVVHEGRLPLWEPNQLCGAPVLALGFAGAVYPPALALFGALPAWAALQGLYGFHAFLMTWGFCAYLRRYGGGRATAIMAALLVIAGTFRGPLLAGVDHPQFVSSIAWFPVVLLCWERAAETGRVRHIGWLALAVAGQCVSGYPDVALHFPVLLGVLALARGDGSPGTRVTTLIAGLILGSALVAVQMLPLAEAAAESPRAGSDFPSETYRALFAVHGVRPLATSFMRRFGPAALVLALVGMWPMTRTRVAWLLALVWATFALNPPFDLLYRLPTHAGVRFPFGWSLMSGVFVAILAAVGVSTLWHRAARWSRIAAVVLGVAAAGHGMIVVARAPISLPGFRPGSPRYRAPDLALVAQRAPLLRRHLTDGSRLLSAREHTAGAALRHGLPLANGQETAVPPRRIVDLLREAKLYDPLGLYRPRNWKELAGRPDIGALLGIGVVAVPRAMARPLVAAGFTEIGSLPPDDLLLRRDPLPRARIVHRAIEAVGESGTLAAVVAHAREAARVAVVEEGTVPRPLSAPPRNVREHARVVVEERERLVVETTVAAAALLVVRDTFYPGWRATVDGEPAPIVRADHAFRGVYVEEGRHLVEFRYAPLSLRLGQAISALAAIVTLGCLALPARRSLS